MAEWDGSATLNRPFGPLCACRTIPAKHIAKQLKALETAPGICLVCVLAAVLFVIVVGFSIFGTGNSDNFAPP